MSVRDDEGQLRLHWRLIEDRRAWRDAREGAYLLRTNLAGQTVGGGMVVGFMFAVAMNFQRARVTKDRRRTARGRTARQPPVRACARFS